MVKASPNDKAMAKKETTEIEILSMSVYMCNLSFLLKKASMPIKEDRPEDGGETYIVIVIETG